MPGNLIKRYTSQADWQSGTAEGLDLVTRPGDLMLAATDYTQDFDTNAEWNTGSRVNTVAVNNALRLAETSTVFYPDFGNWVATSSYNQSYTVRQRINSRGKVASIGWYVAWSGTSGPTGATMRLRRVSDSEVIYEETGKTFPLNALMSITPSNLTLTEDVWVEIQWTNPSDTRGYIGRTSTSSEDQYVGTFQINGDPQSYCGRVYIAIATGYSASGTWTSPWLAHGITSPASTWLSYALAAVPAGSSVQAHIRWSPDNGGTPTEWAEATNGAPLPGTPQAYVQIRLTLTAPPDHQATPVVSTLTVIVGELHRWTSPAINITDTTGPKVISTLVTGLQVSQEVKLGAGAWQASSGIVETGSATTMQIRLTLARTGLGDQYLSELSIFEALILQMLEEPKPQIRPPDVTHVICYVEDSEPLIEVTASLPDVPEDKRIEVRISVPAGSSEAYAQAYANAYLAVHGVEKRSLTCRIPICTRIGFAELVAVAYKPWGRGLDNPWLAMVQEITHYPLAEIPVTELVVGDYQPDDTEALVQLIVRGG